jgi:predicted dehydrogenase
LGRLRIVQVGLGRWGRDWATRALPQVPAVELVGCVDENPDSLAETVKAGIIGPDSCYGSLEAAVGRSAPEAALVTTDLRSHVPVVLSALDAGLHVIAEKPLAPSLDDAIMVVRRAANVGRTLMVSQNYRFFPAVRAVQRLVRERTLGEPIHIDLDFRRFSPPPPGTRQGHRGWAQPLLLDMSIHHFDLMRGVLGVEPTSVFCRTWNPPWSMYRDPPEGTAIIAFGDLNVSYRGSWVNPRATTLWAGEWRMEFEDGEIWWTSRGDNQTATEDEVWTYDHRGNRARFPLDKLPVVDRAGALSAFANAVAQGAVPESSGLQNLGSLALAFAAVSSAARGEIVRIESGTYDGPNADGLTLGGLTADRPSADGARPAEKTSGTLQKEASS